MDVSKGAKAELRARVHRERAVTELGQQALETNDVDQLMHDASAAVAETLDADYCKVLELLPGENEMLLRQGVGWHAGLVGSATVPTDRGSQAGYTLLTEEPVIVDELHTEGRFSGPQLLVDHDVTSGVSVIIGSVEDPWGVLGVHTTERREFTEIDATFVQSVANVLAAAVERREHERELEQFEALINESHDVNVVLAPDGTYQYVAPPMERELGHDPDALVGENAFDYVHPDDRGRVFEAFLELVENPERTPSVEYRFRRGDGSWAVLESRGRNLLDKPNIEGIVVYSRDITERKEREQELARFERAVEASGHAIYMTDVDGEITYVNSAFEEMTGYSREEVLGQTPNLLDSGEHSDEYFERLWETITAGERWDEEIVNQRKNGDLYTAHQTIAPVTDADGDIDQFVAIQIDITERKERERELEQYQALTEAANDAIITIDEHSVIRSINPAVADVFGYDQHGLVGEPLTVLMPDRFADRHHRGVERYLETGERTLDWDYVELPGEHADGSTIPLAISFSEVEFEDEQFFTGIIRDITERKEREQQLEESHERLEQFATAVSHDLKEPLGTVSSYLQLLERRYEDELDEDAGEFIDFAVGGATRMREMIDSIVTEYARVDAEGDPFEPVELEAVLEDVLADLERKIDEEDAEITTDSLPRVEGDANQLHQLFLNLLDNAIKYSGEDPPRIHVSAERDGEKWMVSVSDNGIGIESDATEAVFDVFHRLHDDEYPGTGIGLALCRRIVERHGGDIWVESEPSEGSTFWVTLSSADE